MYEITFITKTNGVYKNRYTTLDMAMDAVDALKVTGDYLFHRCFQLRIRTKPVKLYSRKSLKKENNNGKSEV